MTLVHLSRNSCLAVAGLALLIVLGCANEAAQLEAHQTRGQAYLEEESWSEAELEFRNMLQLDPNSAAAHWGLAQARLGSRDPRGAYWELQETVRLDPENLEARLRYGQFLIFGKPEDIENAVQNADEIIAKDPANWEAFVLKARALAGLSRNDEVGDVLAKASEAAPEEAAPQLLYANFLRAEKRSEEAEMLFRRVIEIEPGFPAYAALAGFLGTVDREDEAEVAFRKALELAKEEERVAAYTMFANYLMARDRGEEAEGVLKEGIEKQKGDVDLVYTLARFYHVQGRREQADAMILEATAADPTDPKPFLLLSNYRAQSGDPEGALEAAELALKASPDDQLAKLRKAEVLVDIGYREKENGKIALGRSIVDAVLSRDAAMPQALFVKAKIDMAENKFDDSIAAARRALDGDADWAQAHFLLGSALFLSGERSQARAAVSRALELDANLMDAQKLLARIHASLGDHKLAAETGRKLLGVSPDVNTRILVAQSLVRLGDLRGALTELDQIPADDRNSEANYALGRVHTLLGNTEAARTFLLASHEADPYRAEILRELLNMDLREGDLTGSAERIRAAVQALPEDSQLRQLAGEISLYSGNTADAEAAFQKAIELNPNDLRAYESLARFLAITGQSTEVLKTYERALASNPKSGPLHLVVGSLYELKARTEEAMEHYEEAIRLAPDLAVAKNNLAYLLVETDGNLDRALDLAQEAKALLPDNPNAADTLGWVLYKKNVPSAAIDYLKEAVGGMKPEDRQRSLVRHHLALAYEADAQEDRARETWDQALSEIQSRLEESSEEKEPPWMADIREGLTRVGS